jgi:phage terminase small subunit
LGTLDTLKPDDRAIVEAYVRPDSATVGNGTQSILSIKPSLSPEYARVAASRLLRKDNIRTSIQELMQKIGLTEQVRAERLKDLIIDSRRQNVKVYDGKGNLKQVIESPVKPADVAKLIDIANKMDGTYARAELPSKLAEREYSALRTEMLREMRRAISNKPPKQAHIESVGTIQALGIPGDGIEPTDASTGQGEGIEGIPGDIPGSGVEGLAGVPRVEEDGKPDNPDII